MGERIFRLVLATASGEHSKSEQQRPERVRAVASRGGNVITRKSLCATFASGLISEKEPNIQ